MSKNLRTTLISLSLLAVITALYIYNMYVHRAKVPGKLPVEHILIPSNSSYEAVMDTLKENGIVQERTIFDLLADQMAYKKEKMRSGRFKVEPGWSYVKLIRHLRNGKQAPVKVVLTNERLPEDVAGKVARFIEPDSSELYQHFSDEKVLSQFGYTQETFMSMMIPNTYEFFWNASPQSFLERMEREHQNFWSKKNRLKKAEQLNMTPAEVYTLASIVEKETLKNQEKQRMAGVYINRLKKKMLLQADPTAVFATRDFNTKRVTNKHTNFDSPYNTYKYVGLPPGPISMSSISSIDAVLNHENHDYLYFCAKGDGSGLHSFAKTLSAHNRNAEIYRRNLRKRGLR